MGVKKKATAGKKRKVKLSQTAILNLDEITGFIAFIKQQPQNAVKTGDGLLKRIEKIGENPFAFSECEYLPTKGKIYRKAIYKSWSIIYKIAPDDVLILGIVHHSRNPSEVKKIKKQKSI
jgi:plasmid stabilization system protein ParE